MSRVFVRACVRRCLAASVVVLSGAMVSALAAQSAPAVLWQSMLNIKPMLGNETPSLRVPLLDVAFMPSDVGRATLVVRRAGAVEATVELTPNQRVGNVQRFEPRRAFAQLEAMEGERTVEVRVGDALAGAMTFTLTKRPSDDPFGTTAGWLSSGPWRDHAYVFRPADPSRQQRVIVSFWESHAEFGSATPVKTALVLRRGSQVIASAPAWNVQGPDWIRMERELRKANGQPMLASDLAALGSGPVTVAITRDGTTRRQWQARLEQGWFVPHAHSATPPPEPAHFLSPRDLAPDGSGLGSFLHAWLTR